MLPEANATLRINEVMTGNDQFIADEDGEYHGWIELMNSGDVPLLLGDFSIRISSYSNDWWPMPNETLAPGDFVLVWISGKDSRDINGGLHLPWSELPPDAAIEIIDDEQNITDSLSHSNIPANESLGRYPNGTGDWFFYAQPSPGAPQSEYGELKILQAPYVSHDPGFNTKPFDLHIAVTHPQAQIFYTLDGSEPLAESIWSSLETIEYRYQQPILIKDRSEKDNHFSEIPTNNISQSNHRGWREPKGQVFKGTTIRARTWLEGYEASDVVTASFFIDENGDERYSLPVISLVTDGNNLFDEEGGIYVAGNAYRNNPATGNYYERGINWERNIHIEMWNEDGDLTLHQNAGVRIHGGFTRRFPAKSLRMYARSDYGVSRFETQLFPHQEPQRYNRFLIRTAGNDFMYGNMRDLVVQRVVEHMSFDTQDSETAILFVNGEYWGIHHLRERYDVHYLNRMYDVEREDIDLLNNESRIPKEGSYDDYGDLLASLLDPDWDLNTTDGWNKLEQRVDVKNYSEYVIAQTFFGNSDWPHNNMDFWRYSGEVDDDNSGVKDGRWRWLMYDVDRSFNRGTHFTHRTLDLMFENRNATQLFRFMYESDVFRHYFGRLYADHINTTFKSDRLLYKIDSTANVMRPYMPEYLDRWGIRDMEFWEGELESMREFARNRHEHIIANVQDHFDLGEPVTITVNTDYSQGYIRLNSLNINQQTKGIDNPLQPYPWSGTYYSNQNMEMMALPHTGYVFSHWKGADEAKRFNQAITIPADSNRVMEAVFVEETNESAVRVSLIFPGDSYAATDKKISFQWEELSGFDIYEIEVSSDIYFEDILIRDVISKTSHTIEIPEGTDTFYWRVRAHNENLHSIWSELRKVVLQTPTHIPSEFPNQLTLAQNYPNPFNPQTTINFELPESMVIRLDIFDVTGRRITTLAEGRYAAGRHQVQWHPAHLASGVYFYTLQTPEAYITKTMVLIQ